MATSGEFGNPLRKFKLVFLGEQSGEWPFLNISHFVNDEVLAPYIILYGRRTPGSINDKSFFRNTVIPPYLLFSAAKPWPVPRNVLNEKRRESTF